MAENDGISLMGRIAKLYGVTCLATGTSRPSVAALERLLIIKPVDATPQ